MKVKGLLVLLCSISFIHCRESNIAMDIRHTSLNDFYADYVFNFKNTEANLKIINDYSVRKIRRAKKYNDSLRRALIASKKTAPSTLEEASNGTFPSTAIDLVLYKPPKEYTLNPVDSADILLIYKIDKYLYKITGIEIPNTGIDSHILVKEKVTDSIVTILECNSDLSLESLKQTMIQIKKLNYHQSVDSYTYQLVSEKDIIAHFMYTEQGKYLEIKFL